MQMKKYMEVYKKIRWDILSGTYRHGQKLPSKRAAADRFSVSVVTVERAYDILLYEGYIESRPKSGFFVTYGHSEIFGRPTAAPAAGEQELRPLPSQKPALPMDVTFPFSLYARAVRTVLSERGEALLRERSPGSGLPELKNAICRYLGRSRNIRVRPEQVVIGSGAESLYGMIPELLGRGRLYAIENPAYEQIERVYRARGVRVELLPLGENGIETQALLTTKASVLHVTPYRSFPTGVTADATHRRAYLNFVRARDRFVIEDDYESEFSLIGKPGETLFGQATAGGVIYLNTFSKTLSPALRVGYMLLPNALLPRFAEKCGFYACSVPVLDQYILARLLDDGSFERHINRVRRARRKAFSK